MTTLPGDLKPSRLVVEDDEDGVGRASHDRFEGGLTGAKVGAIVALAALVLLGLVVAIAQPAIPLAELKTPSPTFSRQDSGTPLPTEAEAGGGIWSNAKGVPVLRPTWLPRSKDEYQIVARVGPSAGPFNYGFLYVESHSLVGTTVWSVELFADSSDRPIQGLQQFGGAAQNLNIRGHPAELFGNGSPGWTLVWNEGNYRYAITAFAVSREDLLRIAGALARVIDETGRVSTRSE